MLSRWARGEIRVSTQEPSPCPLDPPSLEPSSLSQLAGGSNLVEVVTELSSLRECIVRLLLRGKINPLRTLFGRKTPAAEPARRLLGREASQ